MSLASKQAHRVVERQHGAVQHGNLKPIAPAALVVAALMAPFVDLTPLAAGVAMASAHAVIWLRLVDWNDVEQLSRTNPDALVRRVTMVNVTGGIVWGLLLLLMLPGSVEAQLLLAWIVPAALAVNMVEAAPVRSSFLGFHLSFTAIAVLTFAVASEGAARWTAVLMVLTAAVLFGLGENIRRNALERAELALNNSRLVDDLTDANARLERQAKVDDLTGLLNRTGIEDCLARCDDDSLNGAASSLFFIDLDGFKPINDTHGHRTGDRVLIAVADRLREALPSNVDLGRVGGDEFLVVARGCSGRAAIAPMAERIVATISAPFVGLEPDESVTASVGIAVRPWRSGDPQLTVRRADAAMYEAKARGGNTWAEADETEPSGWPITSPRPAAACYE